MGKYLRYKNLNLLLPILGIILMLLIFFFASLRLEVKVNDVVTDTIKVSSYKIMFASKSKWYYTSVGIIFLLVFLINSALLIISNFCIYRKVEGIVKYLPLLGLGVNLITFILFFAMPFSASDNILKYNIQLIGTNIWVDNNIKELPIVLSIGIFIAFAISYGFAFYNFNHLDKRPDDTFKLFKDTYTYNGLYMYMFWLTLAIYLLPLLFILLIILFFFKGNIISSNKKKVIINGKEYTLLGDKVLDKNNNQIGFMKNGTFIEKEKE